MVSSPSSSAPRSHFRAFVLGSFLLYRDASSIDTTRWQRPARSLLLLLLTSPDRRRLRDQAIDLLWPDSTASAGRSNLWRTVHFLRRGLGDLQPSPVLLERGWVILNPSYTWETDLDRFAALLESTAADVETLEEAAQLYRGEPLIEERYADWAMPVRESIQRQWERLMLRLAQAYRARRGAESALQWVERALDTDPLNEEALRVQLVLLGELGRGAEGWRAYQRFQQQLREDLGLEPASETIETAEQVCTPIRGRDGPAHNLPAQATPFIGRVREVRAVRERLCHRTARLLTLLGPGGTGKTRLALEVAERATDCFSDGICFVSLASLRDSAQIPFAVASALSVDEVQGEPLSRVLQDDLRQKELLLVLDNFEHLLDGAELVGELLEGAPQLAVLVTSRAVLGLYGEHTFVVPPMTRPALQNLPHLSEAATFDAMELFLQRARAADFDFTLTSENLEAVATICAQLDGLPLAIELAAARLGDLGVNDLAAQMEQRLGTLTAGPRNLPARQRTLRATLDWSYDLLSPGEQQLLDRLSVFAGGCTLEATEQICSSGSAVDQAISSRLRLLCDQSLVREEEDVEGQPRFVLLETIREYAQERLEERGEAEYIRHRHAQYYIAMARTADPKLRTAEQKLWLDRLDQERANLRAALTWSLAVPEQETAMALASALWGFWWIRGPISEGRGWLDRARALGDSVPRAVQAEALFAAGALAVAQIDTQAAIPLLEKSVVLYSRLDDPLHLAVASLHLANALAVQEEGDRATALYADALRLFQELGDREGMAGVMSNLATARLIAGDREQARRLSEEALTICRDLSDLQGIAGALWNLGDVARLCGQWKRADCIYREMLSLYAALLDQEMLVIALEGFGHAMSELGWPDRAARLWGAAESLRTAIGLGWFDYQRTLYEEGLTTAHHQIDDETWRNLWEDGRAMTPEQAIAYALEERNPT